MKYFSFEVSIHPRYSDKGEPNGQYSVLFTPTVVDPIKEQISEDILLLKIGRLGFLNLTAACYDRDYAIGLAQDFSDMMSIYEMSEQDLESLAKGIRSAALKCAATFKS